MILRAGITVGKGVFLLRGSTFTRLSLQHHQQHPAVVFAAPVSLATAEVAASALRAAATAYTDQKQHEYSCLSSASARAQNTLVVPRLLYRGRSVLVSRSSCTSSSSCSNRSSSELMLTMTAQEGPTQQQLQQEETLKESLRSAGISFKVRDVAAATTAGSCVGGVCSARSEAVDLVQDAVVELLLIGGPEKIPFSVLLVLLPFRAGTQTPEGVHSGGVNYSCWSLGNPRMQESFSEGQERQLVPPYGSPRRTTPWTPNTKAKVMTAHPMWGGNCRST